MRDVIDMQKSLGHLRRDKKIRELIKIYKRPELNKTQNAFQSLAEAIIYQQLSGKAASAILKKFIALYSPKKFPKPEDVLKTSISKLRSAGISNQKSRYLIDLAKKFKEGIVSPKNFHNMTDEEISEHLIRVKGIGQWTADMFLIFALNRPDVLPTGDLGIQKGFKKVFNLKSLPNPEQMVKLAEGWCGHRTLACLYLWKVADAESNSH